MYLFNNRLQNEKIFKLKNPYEIFREEIYYFILKIRQEKTNLFPKL